MDATFWVVCDCGTPRRRAAHCRLCARKVDRELDRILDGESASHSGLAVWDRAERALPGLTVPAAVTADRQAGQLRSSSVLDAIRTASRLLDGIAEDDRQIVLIFTDGLQTILLDLRRDHGLTLQHRGDDPEPLHAPRYVNLPRPVRPQQWYGPAAPTVGWVPSTLELADNFEIPTYDIERLGGGTMVPYQQAMIKDRIRGLLGTPRLTLTPPEHMILIDGPAAGTVIPINTHPMEVVYLNDDQEPTRQVYTAVSHWFGHGQYGFVTPPQEADVSGRVTSELIVRTTSPSEMVRRTVQIMINTMLRSLTLQGVEPWPGTFEIAFRWDALRETFDLSMRVFINQPRPPNMIEVDIQLMPRFDRVPPIMCGHVWDSPTAGNPRCVRFAGHVGMHTDDDGSNRLTSYIWGAE